MRSLLVFVMLVTVIAAKMDDNQYELMELPIDDIIKEFKAKWILYSLMCMSGFGFLFAVAALIIKCRNNFAGRGKFQVGGTLKESLINNTITIQGINNTTQDAPAETTKDN